MWNRCHQCLSLRRLALLCTAALAVAGATAPTFAADSAPSAAHGQHHARASRHALDHSGRKQVGTASVYSRKFKGRRMADGARMDPNAHVAASKTLPLGTEAKVTN